MLADNGANIVNMDAINADIDDVDSKSHWLIGPIPIPKPRF